MSEHSTQFFRKSGSFAKKHAGTSLVAILVSSVIPLLEQWHSDQQVRDDMLVVEARMQKQLDDFKAEQHERDSAQWNALRNKKDK